jgi:hypothetical protein
MLKILFYICVFALSLGQFGAVYKYGGLNVYFFDVAVLVLSVVGVLYFLGVRKSFKLPRSAFLFLFFTFVAMLSFLRVFPLHTYSELLVSGSYLFRWMFYFVAGLVVYNMMEQKNALGKRFISSSEVVRAFVFSAVFVSVGGFIQLLVLPDFTVLPESLGWDPHKNRLASTFFDPNFVGAYLALILAILLFFKVKLELNPKLPHFFVFSLITGALVLTFSRSAWLLFAAVSLVYGLFKSRPFLIAALIIAFAAYFAVPRIQTRVSGTTDPADSAHFRIISWKSTWEIAKENLFLGVGFNTFKYAQKDYGFLTSDSLTNHESSGSDSSLLLVLATTGLLGFVFFAGGLVIPALSSLKNKQWFFVAILGGLLLESQFINSLFYPPILFFWLVFLFNYSSFRT